MDNEIGSNRLAMLAAEIRGGIAGVKAAEQARAQNAVATGRALVEAKFLLRHGRWLPWLKENCALSERSAQLYMSIVEGADKLPDEVLTTLVATFGIKGYAKSVAEAKALGFQPVTVMKDEGYNPLHGLDDEQQRQWLLYALFTGTWRHVEWLRDKQFKTPDEWLGDEGTAWRRSLNINGLRKSPWFRQFPERYHRQWAAFQQKHATTPRAQVEAELGARLRDAA